MRESEGSGDLPPGHPCRVRARYGRTRSFLDWRGSQGNFHVPTPSARRWFAPSARRGACNALINKRKLASCASHGIFSRFQVDFWPISRRKPVMDAPSSAKLYRIRAPLICANPKLAMWATSARRATPSVVSPDTPTATLDTRPASVVAEFRCNQIGSRRRCARRV